MTFRAIEPLVGEGGDRGRFQSNLSEDIPGYVAAPAIALDYPWKHFIGGHVGRLGTRDDVTLHQQYMADIDASVRKALVSVDSTPFFQKATIRGLRSAPFLTPGLTPAQRRSSRNTTACSPRRMSIRGAPCSGSLSRSVWTSASPRTFIRERRRKGGRNHEQERNAGDPGYRSVQVP